MSLAIFDLDNTLLNGDSDHSWGEFMCERDLVEVDSYRQQNDQFYQDYLTGSLDMTAYVAFALDPLKHMSQDQRSSLHQEFMQEKIAPMRLPKADALVEKHRNQGDTLLIITATNEFITGPIAVELGIEHLLATTPELVNGRFSGRIIGAPCFQGGKVTRLQAWLTENQQRLEGSYFYSDSINDLPLLETVDHPVAVDPDKKLESLAKERDWTIISLR
ncbi:MAG: HAD-IB family hydrolase [Agarilytica sp.]